MHDIKHVEIAGINGERLESFYSSLLGWQIERRHPGGFDYGHIEMNDSLSAGIRHEPEGRAEIVIYVEVEDVKASVGTAIKLGAAVRIPPMQAGDVYFALITDPEGNPLGLTQKPDSE